MSSMSVPLFGKPFWVVLRRLLVGIVMTLSLCMFGCLQLVVFAYEVQIAGPDGSSSRRDAAAQGTRVVDNHTREVLTAGPGARVILEV